MTKLLTLHQPKSRAKPTTDILFQPHALDAIQRTHQLPVKRKRRINYARKIMNDPFIMGV